MKEWIDPTQMIQILIATGHLAHDSKRHTCRNFQNHTRLTHTKGGCPIPNTSQSDQAITRTRPWTQLE